MTSPTIRLTAGFLARLAETGLTDAAAAAAIGVSRQFFSQVKSGQANPSATFMAGAVRSGLADNFAEVAEVVPAGEAAA